MRDKRRRAALSVLMAGIDVVAPADGAPVVVPEWLAEALRDGLGSVCLFAMNTPDLPRTRALTDALRSISPNILITVDEEGGDVTRLQAATGSSLPGAAALGVVDDVALTREAGRALGLLIATAGIDLDLAPDLDVASEPRNPVIGVRSFGPTPDLVSRHGAAFAAGLADSGVRSCAKHFPGHGDTLVDSHVGLPAVLAGREQVEHRDLAPFSSVRTDAVMLGHLVVPALGEGLASMSAWAYDLARRVDDPLLVTDALGMAGASGEIGIGEACVRALEAGADLLCLDSPHRPAEPTLAEAVAAIEGALQVGRLDLADLLRRGDKVAAGPRGPYPALSALAEVEVALDECGRVAARRAVTAIGPVRVEGSIAVIDLRLRPDFAAGPLSQAVVHALQQRQPEATVHTAQDGPWTSLSTEVTPVAIVRFPQGDPAEAAALATVLSERPDAVVIHTGVPAGAPAAPRVVVTCGNARPNAAAAAALVLG